MKKVALYMMMILFLASCSEKKEKVLTAVKSSDIEVYGEALIGPGSSLYLDDGSYTNPKDTSYMNKDMLISISDFVDPEVLPDSVKNEYLHEDSLFTFVLIKVDGNRELLKMISDNSSNDKHEEKLVFANKNYRLQLDLTISEWPYDNDPSGYTLRGNAVFTDIEADHDKSFKVIGCGGC